MDPVPVRFLQPVSVLGGPRYRAGEIAGFPPEQAALYIQRQWAVAVTPPPPPLPTPAESPKDKAPDKPYRDKMVRPDDVKRK